MMLRTQWYPFEDLRSAQDELNQSQMNSLFAHALGLHGQRQGAAVGDSSPAWAPALDISERKDAYLVTVELPGVKLDDLQITVEDTLLTIQGERHFAHDSSEQQYHRVERRYGAFRRSITLPAHVMADMVEASFEDGVLQIVVPKAEEAKRKRIQVRPGGEREAIEANPRTRCPSQSRSRNRHTSASTQPPAIPPGALHHPSPSVGAAPSTFRGGGMTDRWVWPRHVRRLRPPCKDLQRINVLLYHARTLIVVVWAGWKRYVINSPRSSRCCSRI